MPESLSVIQSVSDEIHGYEHRTNRTGYLARQEKDGHQEVYNVSVSFFLFSFYHILGASVGDHLDSYLSGSPPRSGRTRTLSRLPCASLTRMNNLTVEMSGIWQSRDVQITTRSICLKSAMAPHRKRERESSPRKDRANDVRITEGFRKFSIRGTERGSYGQVNGGHSPRSGEDMIALRECQVEMTAGVT
ncbi:hypothetical protein BDM02DRAFT_3125155 [Thelephora ganbajun]|uniref:Uncharacterized protein n=1 Tax=Thelephora ganbajun TaxID=370292 RepID=A0ACB6ZYV8_THEGA|nr:hypothetical protein BDM02DRAFT_3125155 [Thelephora ganbajun]